MKSSESNMAMWAALPMMELGEVGMQWSTLMRTKLIFRSRRGSKMFCIISRLRVLCSEPSFDRQDSLAEWWGTYLSCEEERRTTCLNDSKVGASLRW